VYKILAKLSFRAANLHFLPSCHSTNEIAQNLVKAGCQEGTVVITDDQFAGKGQAGNTWQTEAGKNLTFSLILRPEFLKPQDQFLITVAISLSLENFLKEYLPGEIKVKWPNDIYYKGKKIAGMLIENVLRGSNFDYAVIGVGLNVNQEDFANIEKGISMKIVSGENYELNKLLNNVLGHIDQQYTRLRFGRTSELRKEYHENLMGLGEERKFRSAEEEFEGVIQATDEIGRLIVWSPQKTYLFNHKEVEMLF
jgi:BirA family biotin operon repressor/biotin-[acetyl-CoA-carboxylase] ligase